ncbi:NB-ARC domain protein [[Leptolyngbya] sp. PCC 7376]|uniref:tetratricopeptide repeat protein n=1 Tax=[Leptolyngbya] sp. PCC 7376 TaxID=111781 RepID=UPI00029EC382|nr:tetratricopeptide repeat protein [[Leptolyngbya] sp. PCC 7376]AFY39920.1 NB-ARC domain protein [[Leptolyngbya] sp. PCC 7376]
MAAEQNQDPSQINQTGTFGIGVNQGTIESGAVVAGQYTVINQPPKPKPIPSNVRRGSKNYVEREENTLQQIHDKLQAGQGVIVCAVEGMGGVGKTELSLQYAQHYKQEYTTQYFLSLRETKLPQAVVTLASPYLPLPEPMQSATIEEQAAWYWQNWLPDEGKMLVILDDVPNAESIPDLAMPFDPRVKVLVTTRERQLDLNFDSLSLEVLSEEKAIALLVNIVGEKKVIKEIATVKEICKTLGYLPLGLELIGEYLGQNRFLTFAELQKRLSIADESLSRERPKKFYGQRGVMAAIQLSWDDLSEASKRVAMWLGLFAPVEIWWELVEWLSSKVEITETELNEARGELDRLNLIQPTDDSYDFYTIHSLVRDFYGMKLSDAQENQIFRKGFVKGLLRLAQLMPRVPTTEWFSMFTLVIPHLELMSREMLDDIQNQDEDLIWAFIGTAGFYRGQGLYTLAAKPYQRCLDVTRELLGERHLHVAASINNLAELYRLQGKYEEAEPLFLQCLSMRKELLGDQNQVVVDIINNLAGLYREQGKYEEAEPLFLQCLSMRKELLGERHQDVASSMQHLADLYQNQEKYEAAEPLNKKALSMRKELLGKSHPSTVTSVHNLAFLYKEQGKYEEAKPLFETVLSMYQDRLGEQHPYVATSMSNLAELYRLQGRYEAAESLQKKSLSMRKELLGESHPEVASSMSNLALAYSSQGKYEAAEPLYEQALSMAQELLGERHPDVASSMSNLAGLYREQGKYEAAETLFQQALSIYMSALGQDHPHTQNVQNGFLMNKLHIATGLDEEGLAQMEQNNPDEFQRLLQQIMSN